MGTGEPTRWHKARDFFSRNAKAIIISALGSLLAALLLARSGCFVNPIRPTTIYAVGPESGSQAGFWEDILKGVRYGERTLLDTDPQLRAFRIEPKDDEGSSTSSLRIARELCDEQKSRAIMVMGFVESRVAQDVLPTYADLGCRLPTILIATTSSALTERNRDGWRAPVLQLPPSNYYQAVHVVESLADSFGQGPCKLLIFLDLDNEAYARNMIEEFTGYLMRLTLPAPIRWDHVEREIQRDNKSLEKYAPIVVQKALKERAWDVVLVFGMTDKALIVASEIDKLPGSRKPVLVLSDGSTTQEFLEGTSTLKSKAQGTWGAFPYGLPRKDTGVSYREYRDRPTYFWYGYDAVKLASQALKAAGSKVTRAAVGEQFRQYAQEHRLVSGGVLGSYEFARDGSLRLFSADAGGRQLIDQYHLWRVEVVNGAPRWRHRYWRESMR